MCENFDSAVALSLSEGLSLLYIGTEPVPEEVPEGHAAKLMEMGLAEVAGGRFAYTSFGRTVADRMVLFGTAPSARPH